MKKRLCNYCGRKEAVLVFGIYPCCQDCFKKLIEEKIDRKNKK